MRTLAVAAAIASLLFPASLLAQQAPLGHLEAAPAPSPPHGGPRFTLAAALAAADRANPRRAVAAAERRAAESDIIDAGVWTNPVLSLSYARSVTPFTSYDPQVGNAQLTVQQFVETSGVPAARRRAAEGALSAAREDERDVRQGLRYAVREAFVTLAASVERAAVARATAAQLVEAFRVVEARVAAGASPRYDRSRASLALADATAQVRIAEAAVSSARGALDLAVGPGSASLAGLPEFDLFDATGALPPLRALLDGLPEHRADLSAARRRVEGAAAQIDVARRSVFPGVGVFAGVAYGAGFEGTAANVTNRQLDLLVGVNVPLPVVARGHGSVPAASARADAQRLLADAAQLSAEQRLSTAYAELLLRREAYRAYESVLGAERERMTLEAQAGYREGHLSVLELIDAYTAVRDAHLRRIELALGARLAEVSVDRESARE